MDITSYILGKNAGGGGGTPNLQTKSVTITENTTTNIQPDTGYDGLSAVSVTTNVTDIGIKKISEINSNIRTLVDNFNSYIATLPNNYKTLTTENVTLYTPGSPSTYKYYLIQKRSSGKYRVVWCTATRLIDGTNIYVLPTSISWNSANPTVLTPIGTYYKINVAHNIKDTVYISPEYVTIEECIQKMRNNEMTYTSTTNFLAYTPDSPDVIPYSNVGIYYSNYQDSTDDYFITSCTRISSNETIVSM